MEKKRNEQRNGKWGYIGGGIDVRNLSELP